MIRRGGRRVVQAAAVACALLCTPVLGHSQTTDSARTTYTDTDNNRGFNWGWLGLLGLLGLLPRKRKETVVTETRTGGPGGTTGRY